MIHVLAEVEKNIKTVMEQVNENIDISGYIEHTFLKPDASRQQIEQICAEAIKYKFAGVCIPPYFVRFARQLLNNTHVRLVTVVGFPLGYTIVNAKVEETRKALDEGVDEIDMVMNIAALKAGDIKPFVEDIESVATLCRLKAKTIKVILETNLLSDDEIKKACEISATIGVDYVKTCTGFFGGVQLAHVELMKSVLPEKVKIKASGGIRDRQFALALIEAGAKRLGTSSGVDLILQK